MRRDILCVVLLTSSLSVYGQQPAKQKEIPFAPVDVQKEEPAAIFYVSDNTGNPIVSTVYYNSKLVGPTNSKGRTAIYNVKKNDRIQFYKKGFDTLTVIVPSDNYTEVQRHKLVRTIASTPKTDYVIPEPPQVVAVTEFPAEFPGGRAALKAFLKENLVYPQKAKELGIEGKVYLKFVVNADGSITNPMIFKKLPDCSECDAEAMRLVKNMPKWTPSTANGKAVSSYYTLPVSFTLE